MPQDNQPTNLKSRETVNEEFDERFVVTYPDSDGNVIEDLNFKAEADEVKSHISTLRQEDLEVIERWVKKQELHLEYGNKGHEKFAEGFNKLKDDLLYFITHQKTRV